MPAWIIYCLLVLVFWGVWAFLPKISTMTLDASSTLVYQQIGAAVATVAVLGTTKFRFHSELRGSLLAIATGVLGVLGLLCYLQAVVRYRLSVVVMLTALYPIMTVGLSMAILRERLSALQWLGVAVALVAIFLLSTPSK